MKWTLKLFDHTTVTVELDEEGGLVVMRHSTGKAIAIGVEDAAMLGAGLQEAARVAAVARVRREVSGAAADGSGERAGEMRDVVEQLRSKDNGNG